MMLLLLTQTGYLLRSHCNRLIAAKHRGQRPRGMERASKEKTEQEINKELFKSNECTLKMGQCDDNYHHMRSQKPLTLTWAPLTRGGMTI